MNQEYYYVFGYGSLMNDASRLRTAPHSEVITREAVLPGYQRIFNISYGQHVYLNIQPNPRLYVHGTIFRVSAEELAAVRERERHYQMVPINDWLDEEYDQLVYTYIGEDNTSTEETIKQSYIDMCLEAVPESMRDVWLEETVMEFPINKYK
jgi:cation transport regulator ChaC